MKKKDISRVRSEAQYDPRIVGEILHDYLENSNEPFARAYREQTAAAEEEGESYRVFENVYPNTELGVDLKLMTRQPGRMPVNGCLPGVLARDREDHFCFIENASEKKRVITRRNPRVYKGALINVIRQDDGTLYPTFNRPHYKDGFTFRDFCLAAAEELLVVAGLIEK